jgi:hypothetical protein
MRKTPLTRDNTLSSFLFDDTFLCLVLTSVRRQLLFYVLERAREGDEYDVKVEESKERIEAYLKVGYEWVGQDNKGQVYLRKRC